MDAAYSPFAITGGPLTILIGDVAALDFNDGYAAVRRQEHQVDLDVSRLTVTESQSVDEDFPVLQRRSQSLPDLPLGLRLKHRTFWNGLTPV